MPPRIGQPLRPGQVTKELSRDEFERVKLLLRNGPGPSPWYAQIFPTLAGPSGIRLIWKRSGPATLSAEARPTETYMVLGFYCYVKGLGERNFLVWHHVGERMHRHGVSIRMFDASELRPLSHPPTGHRDASLKEDPIAHDGGDVTRAELPTDWNSGHHDFEFPVELRGLTELLILVHQRAGTDALYVVHPSAGSIEVLPLKWWNDGEFDFGYEWITQIVRDPPTGNFVGDGVRIRPFIMDPAGGFVSWIGPPAKQ